MQRLHARLAMYAQGPIIWIALNGRSYWQRLFTAESLFCWHRRRRWFWRPDGNWDRGRARDLAILHHSPARNRRARQILIFRPIPPVASRVQSPNHEPTSHRRMPRMSSRKAARSATAHVMLNSIALAALWNMNRHLQRGELAALGAGQPSGATVHRIRFYVSRHAMKCQINRVCGRGKTEPFPPRIGSFRRVTHSHDRWFTDVLGVRGLRVVADRAHELYDSVDADPRARHSQTPRSVSN